MQMKRIFIFILLICLFLATGYLFRDNNVFYESLNLPVFAPSSNLFKFWIVIYVIISYVVSTILSKYSREEIKDFSATFIVNLILNILFIPIFFGLQNIFLGMLIAMGVFITSLFLYTEVKKIDRKLSYPLILYVVWTMFTSILGFAIYLIN